MNKTQKITLAVVAIAIVALVIISMNMNKKAKEKRIIEDSTYIFDEAIPSQDIPADVQKRLADFEEGEKLMSGSRTFKVVNGSWLAL